MGLLMKSFVKDLSFRCTSSRICTREPVRLTDVVETSYPGTQGWYGLQRIFPLEFFLGGLTGIADRFGLRRTTDESK